VTRYRCEVAERGGHPPIQQADTADSGQVEAAADAAERLLGPIDVRINCAFTTVFAPFTEIGPEEYERVTTVAYLGFVNGTRTTAHTAGEDADVVEGIAVDDKQVGAGSDGQGADLTLHTQQAGGRGGRGAEAVGRRLDLGAQGELLELRALQGTEQITAEDQVDACPVGAFESGQARLVHLGDLSGRLCGHPRVLAEPGHLVVGDEGGDQVGVVFEEEADGVVVEEVSVLDAPGTRSQGPVDAAGVVGVHGDVAVVVLGLRDGGADLGADGRTPGGCMQRQMDNTSSCST
jgi:hypothetical protein